MNEQNNIPTQMSHTLSEKVAPARASGTPLGAAREAFMARCEALNLASGTLTWYEQILRSFTRSLGEKSVTTLDEIWATHLRQHLSELKRSGMSSETVFRVWGALRCAFRFWHRDGLLAKNPMEQVERPRRERILIRPFTQEQVSRLLAMPDVKTTNGLRDRGMMMLMILQSHQSVPHAIPSTGTPPS